MQFGFVGAALCAIVVGVFIVAYNSDASALSGGQVIRQQSIAPFMIIGAVIGFLFFGITAPGRKTVKTQVREDDQNPSEG